MDTTLALASQGVEGFVSMVSMKYSLELINDNKGVKKAIGVFLYYVRKHKKHGYNGYKTLHSYSCKG